MRLADALKALDERPVVDDYVVVDGERIYMPRQSFPDEWFQGPPPVPPDDEGDDVRGIVLRARASRRPAVIPARPFGRAGRATRARTTRRARRRASPARDEPEPAVAGRRR